METEQEFDLKKYSELLYQKRYVFVAVALTITTIAIAVSYYLPKTYEAKSTVLIERNFMNDVIKDIAVTPSVDDRLKSLEVIIKSRYLIRKVLGDLNFDLTRKSDIEVEKLVQRFQKATVVTTETGRSSRSDMDLFIVSFKDENPVLARDYVNALIKRYVDENLSQNRNEAYGASKFLLEQIDLFKNKISSIDAEIARMSRRPGAVAQEKLRVLQKRLDELRGQYTDNHPDVIKLKAEIETLRSQLSAVRPEADGGRKDEQQQTGITSEDPARRNDIAQNPGAPESGTMSNEPIDKTQKQGPAFSPSKPEGGQNIASLERDRKTYQKIYEDLMAALGRSEVSSQIGVQDKGGTFKILEPAILPIKPVSPSRVKIILLGLFAGIGGGIGFVVLLDTMDKSIKTVDALKPFGLPVLAVIPHIQNPIEILKTKRKDLLLYVMTGVYYVCVVGLLAFEFFKRGMQ